MWLDDKLAFLDGDAPETRLAKIRAFELSLLIIIAAEYWARGLQKWSQLSFNYTVGVGIATILLIAGIPVRGRRAAFAGLAVMNAIVLWNEFPAAGNHAVWEFLLCSLCALLDFEKSDERVVFLRATRWMVFLIFFYAAVHKLVHGYYFQGQFLAYELQFEPFQRTFRPLLSATEFSRLTGYAGKPGDGPYLVTDPLFLVVSNAVYVVEFAIAGLMLFPRTRIFSVLLAIVVLLAIEAAAREFFFGLVMLNALLLSYPGDVNRRFVPVFAAICLALVLVRFAVLPEVTFH